MNKIYGLILGFVLLGIYSCGEEVADPQIAFGYDYFPTVVGSSVTYEVDSTVYDLFSQTVFTKSWQVQETITAEDLDGEGRPRFEVARRLRKNSDQAWDNQLPTLFYAVKTDGVAERLEGNLRFLKLVFPATEGKQWEGNTYIDTEDPDLVGYNDWLYRIEDVDMPKSIGDMSFDSTLTVIQNDFSNLQQIIRASETYAAGIGLVEKEFMDIKLQASELPPIETDPWPGRGNDGVHVRWKVISFD